MTRRGTLTVTAADAGWSADLYEFLAARPRPTPGLADLTFFVAPRYEPDPFYEKPPRGVRAKLAWIWRGATWPWWDPPLAAPAERWDLRGVELFRHEFGFELSPGASSAGRAS